MNSEERSSDVIAVLLSLVERKASAKGAPLSTEEMQILREHDPSVSNEAHLWFYGLVEDVLNDAQQADDKEIITSALRGDKDSISPYVVWLIEEVICNRPDLDPSEHNWFLDKAMLLGCGLLVVLVMFAIVMVLGFMSLMK